MSSNNKPQVKIIACSIVRQELERLRSSGAISAELEFIDSMLHIHPEKLKQVLDKAVAEAKAAGYHVLLLFGDCHPFMDVTESVNGVSRVRGINCCDFVLGKEKYSRLRREGWFILMPEWTHRWHEVFAEHLGFTEDTAKEFMASMHNGLLYLDLGVSPVPLDDIEALSKWTGLPYRIERVSSDNLLHEINAALEGLFHHD